jgi:hypothetical protein
MSSVLDACIALRKVYIYGQHPKNPRPRGLCRHGQSDRLPGQCEGETLISYNRRPEGALMGRVKADA